MNRDLCDETFPSSLLIAFDDLSDEIPVSPEPVLRRRQQPLSSKQMDQVIISTSSVVTTTTSITTSTTSSSGSNTITTTTMVTARNLSDEGTGNRTGSRMIVSGSSNTSSGHSSLSTDGVDNRSASSERDSSHDEHGNRSSMLPSFARTTERPPSQPKTDSKAKLRQPRSLENLLQLSANSTSNHQKPLTKDTGSLKIVSGSVNSSGSSNGTDRYHRQRNNKYAHVPSKVKQQIDQLKSLPRTAASSNGDRKTLVRHKSMPETVSGELLDEDEALEQENNLSVLRTMVRELRHKLANLQQLYDFYQAKQLKDMDGLRYKNDFLRMENDRLMELERCREQQRELARSQQQQQSGGSCYGSRSSLHKVHATSSVACQTSPTVSFEMDHFSDPTIGEPDNAPPEGTRARATSSPTASSGTTRLRRSTHVSHEHHRHRRHQASSFAQDLMDSPVLGEFSPDYEQLIPSLGGAGRDGNASLSYGTVYLSDGTDRLLPANAGELEENFDQDYRDLTGRPLDRSASNTSGCRDCRRKKRKKRKTRRQKLASLFCLRRHDESL